MLSALLNVRCKGFPLLSFLIVNYDPLKFPVPVILPIKDFLPELLSLFYVIVSSWCGFIVLSSSCPISRNNACLLIFTCWRITFCDCIFAAVFCDINRGFTLKMSYMVSPVFEWMQLPISLISKVLVLFLWLLNWR